MKVYYYLNYNNTDKSAEFKRKRKMCDEVYKYCQQNGHEYIPCDLMGTIIHFSLDNKAGEKFILVAESEDVLPTIKEPYKLVLVKDFLKGAL